MKEKITCDQLDPMFKYEVMKEPGGEKVFHCFSCDTCTLSCPVRACEDEYNPRTIIRLILLGAKKEVLSSDTLWYCAGCFACTERCPQDVGVTDLMDALKNMASREGYVPKSMKAQIELLHKHGRLLEIGDFENKKRAKQNLPLITEDTADIQRILKLTSASDYLPNESE